MAAYPERYPNYREFHILGSYHRQCEGLPSDKRGCYGEWTPDMGVEIDQEWER